MSHSCSGHHHHHDGKIGFAFWLNLVFSFVELIGGYWVGSVAVLSDAVHDLGDSFSLGLTYLLQRKSRQAPNTTYTYGYKRFAILGALLTSVVLVAGSAMVIWEALERLWQPSMPEVEGMLLLALLGIAVNGAAFIRLKGGESMGERMVRLHMLEDMLGWVAVLVASLVMLFVEIPWLDPLLSLLISAYVLYNAAKGLWQALRVFLQAKPRELDMEQVTQVFKEQALVQDVHKLQLWTLDGEQHVLTAHVVLHKIASTELADLKNQLKESLRAYGITDATLEFENVQEKCAFATA